MTLLTGTPLGTLNATDNITLEGAAYIYFQDATPGEGFNPDANGYYWQLSGTSTYPVFNLGCFQDMAFGEDVTVNAVRCDTIGDMATVQKRNYLEVSFTLLHLFPLSTLYAVLNASLPLHTAPFEKMGIGPINNNQFWHVYMPKVYDDVAADYVVFQLHRAQFVDAFSIGMRSGNPWQVTGIRLRAYADATKPSAQTFATVIRYDPSAVL